MKTVYDDFVVRVKEMLACLEHVESLESLELTKPGSTSPLVLKSLRASCFLQAYNMIEATATKVVEAIFDHFNTYGISFDVVRDEVKTFVIKQASRRKSESLAPNLISIATDIMSQTLEPSAIFSGNIDARKLRELTKQLGYEHSPKHNTSHMKHIKITRNDLAHGDKTFSEVGRDTTVEDLRAHLATAIWHMRGMVRDAKRYLKQGDYLAPPTTP